MSPARSTRRRFLTGAAGAAAVSVPAVAQAGPVRAFDHIALPMQNSDAMIAFYRALGMQVHEGPRLCTVHFGDNMINFHRPAAWQDPTFTNRAPAAKPPCGDLCFVWEGSPEALQAMLQKAGAKVETGPVKRQGGRAGGELTGSSVYVRDPDGNLLEFHDLHVNGVGPDLLLCQDSPDAPHLPENLSDQPFEVITIELKAQPSGAAKKNVAGRAKTKPAARKTASGKRGRAKAAETKTKRG